MSRYLIYVRQSYRRSGDADVSPEQQEESARRLLPAGATAEVIRDTGGHRSGRTDNRDGYRELIARLGSPDVAGVAVYDVSRLARNARLMLNLKHELDARNLHLIVSNLPDSRFDTAIGRYLFGQLCLAAQLQADLDSERMVGLTRQIFEDGGHRGLDPFGYRSARDDVGRLIHPRRLEIVPEEAEIVRRVWRELAHRSTAEVADVLNREGVPHRRQRPWSKDAVKDLWRRGRVYLGFVVHRRGLEERPGTHEPILDEQTYRDGIVGVESRRRLRGRRPKAYRTYLLRGVLHCACGARMRGETRVSRGQEWRYYVCPVADGRSAIADASGTLVPCKARRVPADGAEAAVLDAIRGAVLPERVIDQAREELRRRLELPRRSVYEEQRRRLEVRLNRLTQLYGWGDIGEDEYRSGTEDAKRALTLLPDGDKLVLFDRHRRVLVTMAENIDAATPEQRRELVGLLVERAVAEDRALTSITWTPPARAFFSDAASLWRPRTDSNRRRQP